ncbi:MAG: hypothetical protein IPN42_04650 [Methylococcaceae bacterium]|nr:hypothetical protein [Methylococcaceae bacterium]
MNAVHPAWKWYFWTSIIMTICLLGYDFWEGFANQSIGDIIFTAASYLVDVVSFVCLYGFAWQISLGKCQHWIFFFFVNVVFFIFSMGYAVLSLEPNSIQEVGLGFLVPLFVVGIALTLPMLIANYQYAFRNKHLWPINP